MGGRCFACRKKEFQLFQLWSVCRYASKAHAQVNVIDYNYADVSSAKNSIVVIVSLSLISVKQVRVHLPFNFVNPCILVL